MFVFLKLLLAHLIADFILQFEELYQSKLRSVLGHVIHAALHAIVSLLILWPYLGDRSIAIFILVMSVIHLFQDIAKYRFMNIKKTFFLLFAADQILHVLFLCTVFFLPVSHEVRSLTTAPAFVNALYLVNEYNLYLIAFLSTTFAGSYFLHAFRTSYFSGTREDHFITAPEIAHALVERTVLTGLFLWMTPPLWLLASPAIGLLRVPFRVLRNRTDFLLSFIYSGSIGLLFRFWA